MSTATTTTLRTRAATGERPALRTRPIVWLAGLFFVSMLTCLPGLGAERPLDAHESFVARTASEMARRGEWMIPWFNDTMRLQKPPLAYWLTMITHHAAGGAPEQAVSEWEARCPSVIAGALLAVVTALLGWTALKSWRLGLIAGVLLVSTQGFSLWSRSAQPEMLYALFCGIELLGFLLAARAAGVPGEERRALAATVLAWVGFSLAVLAKGPFLAVFVLVGVAVGLARSRPRPRMSDVLRPWMGLAIVMLLVVPYFAWLARHADGAIEFWRSQMFARTGGVGEAWWRPLEMYYAVRVLELLLPWSVLVPAAVWYLRLRRERTTPAERMLYFAALAPLVIMSFSVGRKSYYLLPVLPAFAVLMVGAGSELVRRWNTSARGTNFIRVALRAQSALGAFAVIAAVVLLFKRGEWVPMSAAVQIAACAAFAVALVLCVLVWRDAASSDTRGRAAVQLCSAALIAFVAASQSGLQWSVTRFTGGEFARDVAEHLVSGRELVVVEGDQQVLLYYADHIVREVERTDLPNVLREPHPKLYVDVESALAQYGDRRRVLVREKARPGDDAMVLIDPSGETVARRL